MGLSALSSERVVIEEELFNFIEKKLRICRR